MWLNGVNQYKEEATSICISLNTPKQTSWTLKIKSWFIGILLSCTCSEKADFVHQFYFTVAGTLEWKVLGLNQSSARYHLCNFTCSLTGSIFLFIKPKQKRWYCSIVRIKRKKSKSSGTEHSTEGERTHLRARPIQFGSEVGTGEGWRSSVTGGLGKPLTVEGRLSTPLIENCWVWFVWIGFC